MQVQPVKSIPTRDTLLYSLEDHLVRASLDRFLFFAPPSWLRETIKGRDRKDCPVSDAPHVPIRADGTVSHERVSWEMQRTTRYYEAETRTRIPTAHERMYGNRPLEIRYYSNETRNRKKVQIVENAVDVHVPTASSKFPMFIRGGQFYPPKTKSFCDELQPTDCVLHNRITHEAIAIGDPLVCEYHAWLATVLGVKEKDMDLLTPKAYAEGMGKMMYWRCKNHKDSEGIDIMRAVPNQNDRCKCGAKRPNKPFFEVRSKKSGLLLVMGTKSVCMRYLETLDFPDVTVERVKGNEK